MENPKTRSDNVALDGQQVCPRAVDVHIAFDFRKDGGEPNRPGNTEVDVMRFISISVGVDDRLAQSLRTGITRATHVKIGPVGSRCREDDQEDQQGECAEMTVCQLVMKHCPSPKVGSNGSCYSKYKFLQERW